MTRPGFSRPLLAWYDANKRDLPWRRAKDPYAVFVSEMMLQQTQVATVIPYYKRWMSSFPDWMSLAKASEEKVLKRWEGLGYYRRARNLREAARMVVTFFGGRLPDTPETLRALPGVGPYSAGAILSIAFGKPYPLVDGNVIRVYARLFRLKGDLKTGEAHQKLWALAERLLPTHRPGDYNQAVMELGATVCHSAEPLCPLCPLKSRCQAFRARSQDKFPRLAQSHPTVRVFSAAALVETNGKVLLRRRPDTARWLKGLWEFPSALGHDHPAALRTLKKELGLKLEKRVLTRRVHPITHHKIEVRMYRAIVPKRWRAPSGSRWVSGKDWGRYALPSAHVRLKKTVIG